MDACVFDMSIWDNLISKILTYGKYIPKVTRVLTSEIKSVWAVVLTDGRHLPRALGYFVSSPAISAAPLPFTQLLSLPETVRQRSEGEPTPSQQQLHRASRLVTMKANSVRQFHRWKSSQNLWSNFALQMRKQKINNIIWLVQGHRTSYRWRWADNLDLLTLCNQFLPFTFQIFLKGLQYQDRYCHYKHIELCVKRSMWTMVRKNERKTENSILETNSNLRTEFICHEHSKMYCQFCLFQNALK